MGKKMTYKDKIKKIVQDHGLISRAKLGQQAKKDGYDNSSKMRIVIKQCLKDNILAHSDKSYILGPKARDQLGTGLKEQYTTDLQRAMQARKILIEEKAAGRERAEKQYATNIDAAKNGPVSFWNRYLERS